MNRRFQINEKIGEYRVVGFIGQGGMGEVYHFYHERLSRSVAVKVLSQNIFIQDDHKTRFINEARLHSRLQHPNIANFIDFQEVGTDLLIFMEFVDGEGLQSLIKRKFFSVEESLRHFESIVEAISYVHSNGIIHRDIKVENIKLTINGVPKLLDFGIAKDPFSQNLTKVGGLLGTPNYLAPEQFENKPASEQTDIWSLGVLLYKMLTGILPFEGQYLQEIMINTVHGRFDPPEKINPAIPRNVCKIINKCLEVNLNKRYKNTNDLLIDVRQVLNERYSNPNYPVVNQDIPQPKVIRPTVTSQIANVQNIKSQKKKPFPYLWVYAIAGISLLFVIFVIMGILAITSSAAMVR